MKALLLDLDNTLIDRDAALLAWLHSVLPAQVCTPQCLEELVARDRGGYGSKAKFFAMLSTLCGAPSAHTRHRFLHEFPRFVRLKSDADALLRTFTGPTVIVTNGSSSMQRRKIASAGLEARTTHVLVSGECGQRKPSAAIFERALELVGCAPHRAMMVGDHPGVDITGARAAGIPSVLVRTRWFDPPDGVATVQALTELAW